MANILVTGGAGFFGGLLKQRLLAEGHKVTSIDLEPDDTAHMNLTAIQGDIRNEQLMQDIMQSGRFETIYHCAAILAHAVKDKAFLWTSNVDGTEIVARTASTHNVRSLIFISSNCLWGHNPGHKIAENEPPQPVEIYGQSKWEAEKKLAPYANILAITTIRCPTIIDEGRLGLLGILFEFIAEGRRVWVVGGGQNKYQFIYAQDLAEACILAAQSGQSALYHIGSDNVGTFHEVYQYVLDKAHTGAKIASLPKSLTLLAMRIAYKMKISPLGPYQYKMIAEDFMFDTRKIKSALGWRPTLSNAEMLWKAYEYYHKNKSEITKRDHVSAHKQVAKMGIIRVLKWMS